ncbi:MAG: TatD family hydrolase, partial [Dehalococcoidia bacterium]|nr:TatD family hydrolase [Dehalococcoidia bacterium]
TDAPYLTPQSRRGRRNEPSFLLETVGRIAEIRAQTIREVAEKTSVNAAALYGIAQADSSAPAEKKEAL